MSKKPGHQADDATVKLWGVGLHRSPETALDGFDLVGTHLIESLVRQRDNLVLSDPGFNASKMSW